MIKQFLKKNKKKEYTRSIRGLLLVKLNVANKNKALVCWILSKYCKVINLIFWKTYLKTTTLVIIIMMSFYPFNSFIRLSKLKCITNQLYPLAKPWQQTVSVNICKSNIYYAYTYTYNIWLTHILLQKSIQQNIYYMFSIKD